MKLVSREDGPEIKKQDFIEVVNSMIEEQAENILGTFFDMFDPTGSESAPIKELAAGLLLTCNGAVEAKALNTFHLFDENADGYLQMEELEMYLRAVFKVIFSMHAEGFQATSADDVAAATAEVCFQEIDTDGDGRSVCDFYRSPSSISCNIFIPIIYHNVQGLLRRV
jgi:Ca2+-binding EF-hand superfamily protein